MVSDNMEINNGSSETSGDGDSYGGFGAIDRFKNYSQNNS